MLSCLNQHPFYRQILMFFYMIYLITGFILQFLIVGISFSSIVLCLDYTLKMVFKQSNNSFLLYLASGTLLKEIVFSLYLFLVFLTIIISLSLPVDHGICYFRFVAVLFTILSTFVIAAIIYFMCKTGFVL